MAEQDQYSNFIWLAAKNMSESINQMNIYKANDAKIKNYHGTDHIYDFYITSYIAHLL